MPPSRKLFDAEKIQSIFERTDEEAIAADWDIVGQDLSEAIKSINNE